MIHRIFALSVIFFSSLSGYSQELEIPESHPRLWWSQETLAAAKTRFDQNPFEPRAKGDFSTIEEGGWKWNNEVGTENALYYLLTGDEEAAQTAIAWAKYNLTETLEVEMDDGISCDRCRWWIQEVILVYDWCYEALSNDDKSFFLSGLSDVVERWNGEERWGTPEEPASNYNQGYMRNSFLWGVASYGEAENAQNYIDHALKERWARFEAYFEEENKSGIPTEGTSYGHTILNYMIVMFETAHNLGVNFFGNDFFKKAIMFSLYHTTPGPTSSPAGADKYVTFPFGDASAFWDSRDIVQEFSPFMYYAAHYYKETHFGELIYDWMARTGVEQNNILLEYLVEPIEGKGITDQPLDYYPTEDGIIGQAFTKTSWDTEASALHFQLVAPELGGHEHQDGLNFSWWRKGSFLTMEVPGRGFGSGYQVPDYSNGELVDVQATVAHNSLLFGEEGQTAVETKTAKVLRLQSDQDFFYAAVDATNSYKSHNEGDVRYNNEFVDKVIREYLFIKPMETLLIFDRMKSNEAEGDFRKTFLIHLLGEPQDQGTNDFLTTYQDQNIYVKTLLPESPDISVISEAEGREDYTDFYRLQVESDQSAEEYFLHVIQAKDQNESEVEVNLTQEEEVLTISLTHSTKGFATVRLNKGLDSEGGSFAYSATNLPQSLNSLHDGLHPRQLTTTKGFRWLNLDGSGGTVLSINDEKGQGLTIWPNPPSNEIYIRGLGDSSALYQILDMNGKVVQSGSILNNRITLSDLRAGVYLINIVDKQGSYVERIIKE